MASYEAPGRSVECIGTNVRRGAGGVQTEGAGCRKPTRDHYRWILGAFTDFVGPGEGVGVITPEIVGAWLRSVSLNLTTQRTYWKCVGIFVRWLIQRGWLDTDVTKEVVLQRAPEKLASKLITELDLQLIIRTAREPSTPYIAEVALATFDLALRLGEECAMRGRWIDLERGNVTIQQEADFTTKSGRELGKPLSHRVADLLANYAVGMNPKEHVFQNSRARAMEKKHTSKTFKRIARLAGLSESITFHGPRHGGLSRAVSRGVPLEAVRMFAGHAKSDMTMRYVHLGPSWYLNAIWAGADERRTDKQ